MRFLHSLYLSPVLGLSQRAEPDRRREGVHAPPRPLQRRLRRPRHARAPSPPPRPLLGPAGAEAARADARRSGKTAILSVPQDGFMLVFRLLTMDICESISDSLFTAEEASYVHNFC